MGKVLRKTGWVPRSHDKDTNWSLFWKNGRLSAEEIAEATLPQHTLNHFPETFHLTKKALSVALLSAIVIYFTFNLIFNGFSVSLTLSM